MSTSAAPSVLLQFGSNPFNARYEDLEGRPAFTMSLASAEPNLVFKLTREANWAQQHPSIMGPVNSYYYLGPGSTPGYVTYGNNPVYVPFFHLSRPSKGSTSRYFTAQSGKEYKWRITPQRMECLNSSRSVLAVWEASQADDEHQARIIIMPSGLSLVSEIITTLILNHMYRQQGW